MTQDKYRDGFEDYPEVKEPVEHACVIMAKSVSKRLPGKNMKVLGGAPLFVQAITYAQKEGVTPIIFTDSGKIRYVSEKLGAIVFPQAPEQFEGYAAIPPAIERLGIKVMGHVQCSNPFHKVGMLRFLMSQVVTHQCDSVYTCERVKVNGHYLGEYRKAITMEETPHILYRYDGNICCCTSDFFLSHENYFLGQESTYIENEFPCSLDIDTPEDWYIASQVANMYPSYLNSFSPSETVNIAETMRTFTFLNAREKDREEEKVLIRMQEPKRQDLYKWYKGANKLLPYYFDTAAFPYTIEDIDRNKFYCKRSGGQEVIFDQEEGDGGQIVLTQVVEEINEFYITLELFHTDWRGKITFNPETKRGLRVGTNENFTVLQYEPRRYLRLDWDKWGVEIFRYAQNGTWVKRDA